MENSQEKNFFMFAKGKRCPSCHGDGQKWVQLPTLEGAGYIPCSTCNGEEHFNSNISEKEIKNKGE